MISNANKIFGISIARQRTRRWVVAVYWIWVTIFSGLFLHSQMHEGLDRLNAILVVLAVVNLSAFLGGVGSAGTVKPYGGIHLGLFPSRHGVQELFRGPRSVVAENADGDSDLDEREIRVRDRMHFVAYTLSRWFALLLFAAYALLSTFNAQWLAQVGPLFFFLLTLVLWSLPQTLILWTEPDMEEAQ
jgi:hypothetical protein